MPFPLRSLFLLLVLLPGLAQASQGNPKIGVVGVAKQTLTSKNATTASRVLNTGDDVIFEDTLTTDSKGQTQLIFIDKSTLTIGANSSVVVDKFVYDPSTSSGAMAVSSTKGVLRFVGGALSKKEPVTIKTPAATIGIRGGIALVTIAEGTGATNATFLYGDQMTVRNSAGESSTTQPGTAISIPSATTAPSAPVTVDAATLANASSQLQNSDGTDVSANDAVTTVQNADGSTTTTAGDETATTSEGSATGGSEGTNIVSEGATGTMTTLVNDAGMTNGFAVTITSQATQQNMQFDIAVGEAQAPITAPTHTGLYSLTTKEDLNFIDEYTMGELLGVSPSAIKPAFGFKSMNASGALIGQKSSADIMRYQTQGDSQYSLAYPFHNTSMYGGQEMIPLSGLFTIPATPGSYSFGNVIVDNTPIQTLTHTSRFGNMHFFAFDVPPALSGSFGGLADADSALADERFTAVLGTQAASLPTTGLNSYRFLPEMLIGGSTYSPFAYAMLDNALLPASLRDDIQQNNPGLMVDWSRGTYLTGYMLWNNPVTDEDGSYTTGMMAHMGDVSESGIGGKGGRYVMKRTSTQTKTLNIPTQTSSVNRSNVYGANGQVDGFVMDASYQNFPVAGISMDTRQVATQIATPATIDQTNRGTGPGHDTGYAAGFIQKVDQAGNVTYQRVSTYQAGDLKMIRNDANNTIGADIKVGTVDANNTTSGSQNIQASFGVGANQNANGDSAFIDDQYYAAQQTSLTTQGFGTTTASQNGMLVSGGFGPANMQCTTCDYVGWGAWGGEAQVTTTGGATYKDNVAMIPYVTGRMTTSEQLEAIAPVGGGIVNASYSGNVMGSVVENNTLSHNTGTFNAQVNLTNRSVTSFNGTLGNHSFNNAGLPAAAISNSGAATFTNLAIHNTTQGLTGNVNGALFGPAAQNIGGNINFTTPSAVGAAVYMGSQP